jgi:hypothetical protein
VLREGDLLLEDRGFLDGEMLPYVKQERKADVIHPLRANMAATIDAIAVAGDCVKCCGSDSQLSLTFAACAALS